MRVKKLQGLLNEIKKGGRLSDKNKQNNYWLIKLKAFFYTRLLESAAMALDIFRIISFELQSTLGYPPGKKFGQK